MIDRLGGAIPSRAIHYDVTAVRYGTVRSTAGDLYYRYETFGESDIEVDMDFFFWVLRRDGQTILVDTGFAPAVGARRGRTCISPPALAVSRLGIEPESVSHVIITHLHYDHIGNVREFPAAELIVPAGEWEFWTGPMAAKSHFAALVENDELSVLRRAKQDGRMRLTSGTEEILPGVIAMSVGGHSPGQQVTVLARPSGDLVLASDAAHFYSEFELDRPFGVVVNLAEMYAAYEVLREFTDAGATVVPGHDPDVLRRFPVLERSDGNAVRLG